MVFCALLMGLGRLLWGLERFVAGGVRPSLLVGNNGAGCLGSVAGLIEGVTGRLGLLTVSQLAGVVGRDTAGAIGAIVRVNVTVRQVALAVTAALREIGIRRWSGAWSLPSHVVVMVIV